MESHHLGNIQNGILGASQQIARLHDPGIIYKVQRGRSHDIMEYAAEVSRAPVAQLSQKFNGELLVVIILNVIQRRSYHESVIGI